MCALGESRRAHPSDDFSLKLTERGERVTGGGPGEKRPGDGANGRGGHGFLNSLPEPEWFVCIEGPRVGGREEVKEEGERCLSERKGIRGEDTRLA